MTSRSPRRILPYEHRSQPLLPRRLFIKRLINHALLALAVVGVSLAIGVLGYRALVGHAFVNPLVDLFAERVERTDALFPGLREHMRQQGYDEWRSVVYEHLVRASTVRFAFRELGEVAGRKALEDEISRRFLYVPALCTKLEQYEKSRDRYSSLADF